MNVLNVFPELGGVYPTCGTIEIEVLFDLRFRTVFGSEYKYFTQKENEDLTPNRTTVLTLRFIAE